MNNVGQPQHEKTETRYAISPLGTLAVWQSGNRVSVFAVTNDGVQETATLVIQGEVRAISDKGEMVVVDGEMVRIHTVAGKDLFSKRVEQQKYSYLLVANKEGLPWRLPAGTRCWRIKDCGVLVGIPHARYIDYHPPLLCAVYNDRSAICRKRNLFWVQGVAGVSEEFVVVGKDEELHLWWPNFTMCISSLPSRIKEMVILNGEAAVLCDDRAVYKLDIRTAMESRKNYWRKLCSGARGLGKNLSVGFLLCVSDKHPHFHFLPRSGWSCEDLRETIGVIRWGGE